MGVNQIPDTRQRIWLSAGVFALVAFLLGMVQWKVERPMLMLERFIPLHWVWQGSESPGEPEALAPMQRI